MLGKVRVLWNHLEKEAAIVLGLVTSYRSDNNRRYSLSFCFPHFILSILYEEH